MNDSEIASAHDPMVIASGEVETMIATDAARMVCLYLEKRDSLTEKERAAIVGIMQAMTICAVVVKTADSLQEPQEPYRMFRPHREV